jgi:hypothetical protein
VVERPLPGSFDGTVNSAISFTAVASDVDPDTLSYYWDFGDGEYALSAGTGMSHTYLSASGSTGFVYRVWVNDNNGSNVSSLPSVAVINGAPTVSVSNVVVAAGNSHTYTATVTDEDLFDTHVITWNFGDGTPVVVGNDVTHVYATSSMNYTLTVWADDGFIDDFGASHNVTDTAVVTTVVYDLALVPGWNFVTIPPMGNGYKAGNLGLMTGDIVSGFNPATGVYDKNFIVGVSPPPLSFTIVGSTGYWIYAGAAETLHLYGTVPTTTQTLSITVPVGGGWAMIGFNSLKTTMKASNIPGMFSGGVTTVASYDPSTGSYKSYITGLPFTDYSLVPGQAYWVYCSASGTLTYSP